MEDVLVKFVADTSDLKPGIDGLVQLEVIDKQVADQAKKTNEAMKQRDKAVSDSSKNAKKDVDALTKAMQNVDKAIVGGASKKIIGEIRQQLNLTTAEAKKFYQAIADNSRIEILKGGTDAELKQFKDLLHASTEMLSALGNEEEKASAKTQSFKARLKELKAAMQEAETAGQEDSVAFQKMAVEAAKLEDQIGDTNARVRAMASDTFAFDAMIDGITGVTAAASIAQGATALLSDENKDLQEALLKVQAAQSILMGLQQVQATIQKQSAASVGIEIALRRLSALNTRLQTAAESEYVIVRYAAIGAQKVLNAVMAASPAGIILLALGAVAAMLLSYKSNSDEATAAQMRFNGALNEANALLEAELGGIENANKKIVASLKERGASDKKLADQEISNTEAKKNATERALAIVRATLNDEKTVRELSADDYKKLTEKELDLQLKATSFESDIITTRSDIRRKGYLDDLKSYQAFADAKVLQQKQGSIAELEAQKQAAIAAKNAQISSDPNITAGETLRIQAETNRKLLELDNAIAIKQLEAKKFVREAALSAAKKGSIEELILRKEVVHSETDIELQGLTVTTEQRLAIKAKEKQQLLQLDRDIATRKLELEAAGISTRLAKTIEGSAAEYNERVNLLENEKQIELISAGDITEKKEQIEAEYQRRRLEMTRDYNRRIAEDSINGRMAEINSQIAQLQVENATATNTDLLEAKKKLVDEQAALEIVGIEASVQNEELRRVKVKAVYDRALADKKQLEKDKSAAELNESERYWSAYLTLQANRAQREMQSNKSSDSEKMKAASNVFFYKNALIDSGLAYNKDRLKKGIITQQEYNALELESFNQKEDLKTQKLQSEQAKRDQILDFANQFATVISTGYFDLQKNQLQEESEKYSALKDKKIITEEAADQRLRAIKRKQAKLDQEQALFNIALSTAMGIARTIADVPKVDFGISTGVLIALYSAMGAAQAAFVLAKGLPKFRHGVVGLEGPGTETSDSIPAFLSKNESVITADATNKWSGALKAMNANRFEDYIASTLVPKFAHSNISAPAVQNFTSSTTEMRIDYDRMGEAFAKHVGNMADIPGINVSIDQNGIAVITIKRNEEIQFQNQRYSFK
jgi:hypothetical protein